MTLHEDRGHEERYTVHITFEIYNVVRQQTQRIRDIEMTSRRYCKQSELENSYVAGYQMEMGEIPYTVCILPSC